MKGEFIIDKRQHLQGDMPLDIAEELCKRQQLHLALKQVLPDIELNRSFEGNSIKYFMEFTILTQKEMEEINSLIRDIKQFKPSHEIEWRMKEIFKIVNK